MPGGEVRSVCVYCGSQNGTSSAYREAGRALGRALARAGIGLVYGGGAKGIMGALADGALSAGGRVTGIIPRFLVAKEANGQSLERLSETVLTDDMHQRKHAMFDRSDAFVALPGGIGTLEEIVEIMTWAQLARHTKPIALVNVGGFWDPLLALLDHMGAEGFIHAAHRVRPLVASDPVEVVAMIVAAAGRAAPQAERDIARM
ncbi:MAG: cytokinin riboside 5'-monophosphate phosphoribohydrolase [Alphaproteobacteria bacterium]|nr:MAG: cytokinin riboside 5'-monophosphate phosphoribohydrolase [Alphaproteobacteria bacterium]